MISALRAAACPRRWLYLLRSLLDLTHEPGDFLTSVLGLVPRRQSLGEVVLLVLDRLIGLGCLGRSGLIVEALCIESLSRWWRRWLAGAVFRQHG